MDINGYNLYHKLGLVYWVHHMIVTDFSLQKKNKKTLHCRTVPASTHFSGPVSHWSMEDLWRHRYVGCHKWQRRQCLPAWFLRKRAGQHGVVKAFAGLSNFWAIECKRGLDPIEELSFFSMNRVECWTSIILTSKGLFACCLLSHVETIPFWILGDSNHLLRVCVCVWDSVLSRSRLGQKNVARPRVSCKAVGVDVNHQLHAEKSSGPG